MSTSRTRLAVLFALGAFVSANPGWAASPAEVAAHRQEILDDMLTDKYQPGLITGLRRVCALGGEPASVAEDRRDGAYFTPDAADSCVTALVRTARDGHLGELYVKLTTEMGGSTDGAGRLPRAIGAAVLNGATKVAIGNNKMAVVPPALAFDAGFSVAYQDGTAAKAPAADAGQLKAIAESCLGQHQDAGTCFSAGYVYGARAFNARGVPAR